MKNISYIILTYILLFLNINFGIEKFDNYKIMEIPIKDLNVYYNENFQLKSKQNNKYFYLKEYTIPPELNIDLFLDFESKNNQLNNYKILYSLYEENNYEFKNGNKSGKFYLSDHYISLLPLQSSLFYPGNILDNFTIEYWIYFYQNYDNQYILRYKGNNLSDEKDKNTYGISIYTKNGKIYYSFENLFWDNNKESYSIELNENDYFKIYQWEHHAITFNMTEGKFTIYKNGIEQSIKFINPNRKIILTPKIIKDLTAPLTIGFNSFFSIDNFTITRTTYNNFHLKKHINKVSYLISDVYKLTDTFINLSNIKVLNKINENSLLKIGYRISKNYFLPDDDKLPWIFLSNNSIINNEFSSGKYFQIKLLLYPDIIYDDEQYIEKILISYYEKNIPDQIEIVDIKPMNNSAEIFFLPSPEEDVIGYEIYYGDRTGEYFGYDAFEGKSPIFILNNKNQRLEPIKFRINGLLNEKQYYFSIRCVDKYGLRSEYSKEVMCRPSSIYDSENYSINR